MLAMRGQVLWGGIGGRSEPGTHGHGCEVYVCAGMARCGLRERKVFFFFSSFVGKDVCWD